MSVSNEDNWLARYYNRIQNDCILSIERRDRITRLSYTILAAVTAIYAGFFADGSFVTPLGRFILVSAVLVVLIKFFFQSMIAYGYFLRGRYFRKKIEQYWMNNMPSIDEIKQDINKYDHNKAMPETERNRLMGQTRSGSIQILSIPIILLLIELYLDQSWYYCAILLGLVGYTFLEIYNFITYDQMRYSKTREQGKSSDKL